MKYVLVMIILLPEVLCGEKPLPELDPSKPIYQPIVSGLFGVGGVYRKVRERDPETVEEFKEKLKKQDLAHKQAMTEKDREHKVKEHALGSLLKVVGWIIIAVGAAGHFITAWPILRSLASSIMTCGAFSIVAGFGLQKTVEFDKVLTYLFVFGILCLILYKYKDWSASHGFTWLKEKLGRRKDDKEKSE